MAKDLIPIDDSPDESRDNSGATNILNIKDAHFHASDLDSLTKLAEVDPDLAREIIEQKESSEKRQHASYRFGLVTSTVLVIFSIISMITSLALIGPATTLLSIVLILAMATLIRVILTGQWSESNVIGKFITLLSKSLGSKKPNDE